MKQISGNKLLVRALKEEGVDTIFGYPGACTIDISDELYKQDDIRIILPRHEQALVHEADAYARTTLAPAGVAATYERVTPAIRHTTEITAAFIITLLNVLHTRIDVNAGKMIRLEINNAPIIRIPSTIVTAVSTAINVL